MQKNQLFESVERNGAPPKTLQNRISRKLQNNKNLDFEKLCLLYRKKQGVSQFNFEEAGGPQIIIMTIVIQ